jgi:hypothetical protein
MTEKLRFGGVLFGYDTLVKAGENFVALQGDEVPELSIGMKVVLLGDSTGYVPSGFRPGEEVTIVGFQEPFKRGASDHIVEVTNGAVTGRVKPSNIQMNLALSGNHDPAFGEFGRQCMLRSRSLWMSCTSK